MQYHWYCRPIPSALTDSFIGLPSSTVWLTGCCVMASGWVIVTVMVSVCTVLPNRSVMKQ